MLEFNTHTYINRHSLTVFEKIGVFYITIQIRTSILIVSIPKWDVIIDTDHQLHPLGKIH